MKLSYLCTMLIWVLCPVVSFLYFMAIYNMLAFLSKCTSKAMYLEKPKYLII